MAEDERSKEVQVFRDEFAAARVHILTLYTPLQAHMSRFAFVEREAGAMLVTCLQCPLRAPLSRGEPQPISAEVATKFIQALSAIKPETLDDYYAEGVHDGTTMIYERADSGGYHIVHILQPPNNSPYTQLINAWSAAFPGVRRVLR
ncbi:MAG TPA: hypothetical protein VHP83_04000 [Aggregatilineaceae bacterium]|nr:hypothetical protein [Aggregatilineaceae bacterium]